MDVFPRFQGDLYQIWDEFFLKTKIKKKKVEKKARQQVSKTLKTMRIQKFLIFNFN